MLCRIMVFKTKHYMDTTKFEKQFFFVIDAYYYKVDESDSFEDIFEVTESALSKTLRDFKDEIIENITNLSNSNRDFYLNRIFERANKIIVNIVGINSIFYVWSGHYWDKITELDLTLIYGLPTLIHTEENQITAYLSMKGKFKNEIIEFISELLETGNKTTKPTPPINFETTSGIQLSTNLTEEQRSLLYDLLIDGGFIPADTGKDGFLWAFGEVNDKSSSFKTTWLVDAVYLTDLLREIKKDEITLEEMKIRAKSFFINRSGEEVRIESYKKKASHPNYRKILKIINTVKSISPE